MSKYYLTVIGANTSWDVIVEADYFHTTISNSTTSCYYGFYINNKIIACYPINRTIINKIEYDNETI
jgi:hypothetical protein